MDRRDFLRVAPVSAAGLAGGLAAGSAGGLSAAGLAGSASGAMAVPPPIGPGAPAGVGDSFSRPAAGGPAADDPATRVRAAVVSELDSLLPGRVNMLGVRFDIRPGWHLYWPGRNDVGFGPEVELSLPPGLAALGPRWPAPDGRSIAAGGLLDHIYEDTLLAIVPVRVAHGLRAGEPVVIGASLNWLVCSDVCELGSAEAELQVAVARPGAAVVPGEHAGAFAAARRRLPEPFDPGRHGRVLRVRVEGDRLRVRAEPGSGAAGLAFYPYSGTAEPVDLVGRGEVGPGRELSLAFRPGLGDADRPRTIAGVVEVFSGGAAVPGADAHGGPAWGAEPGGPRGAEPTGGRGRARSRLFEIELPLG